MYFSTPDQLAWIKDRFDGKPFTNSCSSLDQAADTVYQNGNVYTVDANNSVRQALAVRDGKIIYVGTNEGVASFIGPATSVTDLKGRVLMPGLVDGHLHPIMGGGIELSCNLHYAALTKQQVISQLQTCLNNDKDNRADNWLSVYAWFRQAMLPKGTDLSKADLDTLKTSRPIAITSSDGHTLLTNSRAIQLAGVTDSTPNPSAGSIAHDAAGHLTGVFEDGARALIDEHIPQPAPEMMAAINIAGAKASLLAMNQQGITTFLDAMGNEEDIVAFKAVQDSGQLTARAHFAPVISPDDAKDPVKAAATIKQLADKYDQGKLGAVPGITVRNAKMFLDGVVQAPAMTASVLQPYNIKQGADVHAVWVPGTNSGQLYFDQSVISPMLVELARVGIDPHMHTDGEGAVHVALNAVQVMRDVFPGKDIRPALAHNETIVPGDYVRFRELNATPVLSFQWGKPAPDTIDTVKDYIGPARFPYLETAGKFDLAGVRIAYGSDWPVDKLDEWFAIKVGVTRSNRPDSEARFSGRLGDDPGLSPAVALRAITINSSYELHQDDVTGSLEAGKFADMIVLDRNPITIPNDDIANVKVLMTIVGGKVVYQAEPGQH
jgi:predicted amidohydrolase YtcJ